MRVDAMMEAGLLDEVKGLSQTAFSTNSTALQAIGYKELIRALRIIFRFRTRLIR